MLRTLAISLGLAALACAQFETDDIPFDQWVGITSKVYSSPEEQAYRQTVYKANVARIQAHNAKSKDYGFTMGINDFADLTADEWISLYTARGLIPDDKTFVSSSDKDDKDNLSNDPNYWGSGWEGDQPTILWPRLRGTSPDPIPSIDTSPSSTPYPVGPSSSSSPSTIPLPSASSTRTPWEIISVAPLPSSTSSTIPSGTSSSLPSSTSSSIPSSTSSSLPSSTSSSIPSSTSSSLPSSTSSSIPSSTSSSLPSSTSSTIPSSTSSSLPSSTSSSIPSSTSSSLPSSTSSTIPSSTSSSLPSSSSTVVPVDPSPSSSSYPIFPSRSPTRTPSGIPSKLPSASSTASKLPSPSSANTIVPTQTGTTVDWQTAGKVTAVRNQGSCGSCYSFATVAAVESWTAINQGTLPSLSTQQIVDCDSSNFGCGGGYITSSLNYAATKGLCASTAYPYTSSKGVCQAASCTVVTRPNGYRNVQSNSQSALENALRTVPVVVAIDAGTQAWQFYQSGIVTSNCGTSLNHAVLAVGFGTDSSTGISYWRIKNSWGGSWGESGYIRLGRGSQYGSQGTCGILMQPSYPI